jgi:glutathione synthase/RimK-type ligase-like ATP-grasp enzyme
MSETTTDHEKIRKWAEKHGGKPAVVKSTHGERGVGIIRIEFPDAPNSRNDSLEEISWEEFFKQFDENELALVFEEKSNFNKIISRDSAK